jgi:hypothetical protein
MNSAAKWREEGDLEAGRTKVDLIWRRTDGVGVLVRALAPI